MRPMKQRTNWKAEIRSRHKKTSRVIPLEAANIASCWDKAILQCNEEDKEYVHIVWTYNPEEEVKDA